MRILFSTFRRASSITSTRYSNSIILRIKDTSTKENPFQICGVVSDSTLTGITTPKTVEFGSALFPTLLLLNHSCDTNTLRINMDGDKVSER